jgi:hypothetical protein
METHDYDGRGVVVMATGDKWGSWGGGSIGNLVGWCSGGVMQSGTTRLVTRAM